MGQLFSLDSPVVTFFSRITDIIILSLLWVICCIPVVTIVPATSAVYYVTLKMVRQEDSGIIRSFFHSFKDNLKQGILLTLLFLVCGGFLYLDYMFTADMTSVVGTFLNVVFIILAVVFAIVVFYTFPIQARFANTIGKTLKNALILAVQNKWHTLFVVAMNLIPVLVTWISVEMFLKSIVFWLLFAPGGIAYLCSRGYVKIFTPLMQPAVASSSDGENSEQDENSSK